MSYSIWTLYDWQHNWNCIILRALDIGIWLKYWFLLRHIDLQNIVSTLITHSSLHSEPDWKWYVLLGLLVHSFIQVVSTVLVIHCCVTHHSETWWFQIKIIILFSLLISVNQILKGSAGWFWSRVSHVVSNPMVAEAARDWVDGALSVCSLRASQGVLIWTPKARQYHLLWPSFWSYAISPVPHLIGCKQV